MSFINNFFKNININTEKYIIIKVEVTKYQTISDSFYESTLLKDGQFHSYAPRGELVTFDTYEEAECEANRFELYESAKTKLYYEIRRVK